MNKLRSVATAILLCFLLASVLSACGGTSGSTTPAVSQTATSNVQMSVAAGNQQVTVSWTDPSNPPSSNATSSTTSSNMTYNVYCSKTTIGATPLNDVTGPNATVFMIASNTTSPFVHTGLTNGIPYYYFVTRATGGTNGQPSLAAMAVPQAATPAAPTGMTISTMTQQSKGSVTLTIPNPDASLTYNVYWSTSGGVTKASPNKITNAFTIDTTTNTATFTHYNLPNDGSATYYYIVTAQGDSESNASQQLSATPLLLKSVNYSAGPPVVPSQYGSPDNLSVLVGNQKVIINWNATTNTPSITESTLPNTTVSGPTYNIHWWTDPNSKNVVTNVVQTTNGFVLNSLSNGTPCNFYVTAVQTVSNTTTGAVISTQETASSTISVIPQAIVLAMPSAVAAVAGDQQVSLSWSSVTDPAGGAVKYNVYCTTTAPASGTTQSNWTLIGTTSTYSYVHSGLTAGYTYYYVITSISDQSAESAGSWTTPQVSITL